MSCFGFILGKFVGKIAMNAVGEFFAEASEEFIEGVGGAAALLGELLDLAALGVGSEEEFLMRLGELGHAGAQGAQVGGLFFGLDGVGFVGEKLKDLVAEDEPVALEFSDGGKALEANNDFGPGKEAVFVFQLVELLPKREAGFLNDFVDETPVGQHGARVGAQGGFMCHQETHEVAFVDLAV